MTFNVQNKFQPLTFCVTDDLDIYGMPILSIYISFLMQAGGHNVDACPINATNDTGQACHIVEITTYICFLSFRWPFYKLVL